MKRSERQLGVYQRRKLAGLCVDCAAGLTDEDTAVRCLECRARNVRSQLKYIARPDRETKERERLRAVRAKRRATGRCTRCGRKATCGAMCNGCGERLRAMKRRMA